MEKSEKAWFGMYGLLIALSIIGLSLILSPGSTQAAGVNCTTGMSQSTDVDKDGFTDYQECYGFNLINGTRAYGKSETCPPGGICLDPDNKDLFVILVPALPSYLPLNPLQNVSDPVSAGGLGINVHLITPSQANPDRTVTTASTQKAVMITESLDTTSPTLLGFSNTGTPDNLDNTTIYTQRIINFISTTCNGAISCADSVTGARGDALVQQYMLHIINHEVGHVVGPLAPTYNATYGGYHYKTANNGYIMDQSIYYTSKGGKVVFYIGTGYTAKDQSSIKLVP